MKAARVLGSDKRIDPLVGVGFGEKVVLVAVKLVDILPAIIHSPPEHISLLEQQLSPQQVSVCGHTLTPPSQQISISEK
jgi:hypothetical protein